MGKKFFGRIALALLLLTAFCFFVDAAVITKSGTISASEDWTADNTYFISTSVTFNNAAVLTIEPGTVIKYAPSTSITISTNARVVAEGNSSSRITFTSCKDNSIGEDTSAQATCTGTLTSPYYSNALDLTTASGVLPTDNFSYLDFFYSTNGLRAFKDFNSVHDCNFVSYSSNAVVYLLYIGGSGFPTPTFTIQNNNFDGNGTGFRAIYIDYNYYGLISNNTFRISWGWAVNTRDGSTAMVRSIGFTDNLVNITNGYVFSYNNAANSLASQDINILRNQITIDNNLSTSSGFRITAPWGGVVADNNFIGRGLRQINLLYVAATGDVNVDFLRNNFVDEGYNVLVSLSNTGYYSGNIVDNNFLISNNHGFYKSDGVFYCDVNFSNNIVEAYGTHRSGTYNPMWFGVYLGCGFRGQIYDNNFVVKNQSSGIRIGASGLDSNATIRNNYFMIDSNVRGTNNSYGFYSDARAFYGDIYNNTFDVNGKHNTSYYDWGLVLGQNYDGSIYDNNFLVKNYAVGIYSTSPSFMSGSIIDNNFMMQKGFGFYGYNVPTIFNFDMNRNIFSRLVVPGETFAEISNHMIYIGHTASNFSGKFCDNNASEMYSPNFYFGGTFSGIFCNNTIIDSNVYTSTMFSFNGIFNGKFIDNNYNNILVSGTGTTKYFARFNSLFNGELKNNSFSDINVLSGSTSIFYLAGTTNTGNITDNNFSNIVVRGTGHSFFSLNASGTFSGNISRNRFIGSSSQPWAAYLLNTGSTIFEGNFSSNLITGWNGGPGTAHHVLFYPSSEISGNIFDNNISDNNNFSLYAMPVTGQLFSGNFYDNIISDLKSSTGLQNFMNFSNFSGNIYDNKFFDFRNNRILAISGTASGSIHNNLVSNVIGDPVRDITGLFFFGGATSTRVVNNTMNNFPKNGSYLSYAIYAGTSALVTSTIQNNLFTNGDRIFYGNARMNGVVSNNAYYNITAIGALDSWVASDLNSQTGFIVDPFVGDNSDRNFLFNTHPSGGALLVNAGIGTDVNSFYLNRTTQVNNSLDRNIIDIGYHYDQNAPFVYVTSPNGDENVSGSERVDFNIESSASSSSINASLAYSTTTSGGTSFLDANLSTLSCTSGPVYSCAYSWDASDARDGNYYIVLVGTVNGSTSTDSSDRVFYVLSVPKVSLKTYLADKPRSFFAAGQDVNIIVHTNSSIPLISIIAPDGNVVVNSELMSDITSGDMNTYQYTYRVDSNVGWYNVRLSGKIFNSVFYRANEWSDKFTDSNGTLLPFSMDFNIVEPGVSDRWLWVVQAPVTFSFGADENAVRVLEYSPSDSKYLEVPSQLFDKNIIGSNLVSANLGAFVSIGKGEERNFFIAYSKSGEPVNYVTDASVSVVDTNFIFENSVFKAIVSFVEGGLVRDIFSKIGSNTSIAGYSPASLSPEAKAGLFTSSAVQESNPSYTIDINGPIYSKIFVRGTSGDFDYNINYHFYGKQPFFKMDLNVKPLSSKTWSYLYDDYFALKEGMFNKLAYLRNLSYFSADINTLGSSSAVVVGDANYWGAYKKSSGDGYGSIYLQRISPAYSVTSTFNDYTGYEYITRNIYSGAVTTSSLFQTKTARAIFNPWNNSGDINELYNSFANPLSFTIGSEISGDHNYPIILSYEYSPLDVNDNTDLNFGVSAVDNIEILYIDINAQGHGFNYFERKSFSSENASASFVIPRNIINAGSLDVNLLVTDIATNVSVQSIHIDVNDFTSPEISLFSVSPDSNSEIDPQKSILFSVGVNEFTGISSAKILARDYNRFDSNASWSDWSSYDLNLVSNNDYNYSYDYNYLLDGNELMFEFKAQITDVNGLASDSNVIRIYSEFDYTWVLQQTTFSTTSAALDSNTMIDDFVVSNTGDKNISFTVSSNWDYPEKVFFNGTPSSDSFNFTLIPGEDKNISTIVTAKSTERSDTLVVTVDAGSTRASPDQNQLSGTIISFANGPFMFLEMISYPVSVTQGNSDKNFILRVINKGNVAASLVDINWTLPEGWSLSSGSLNSTVAGLGVNESAVSIIKVSISSSAPTGSKDVLVTVTPDSNSIKSKSKTVSVVVSALPGSGDDDDDDGGSGTAGGNSSNGTGSGGGLPLTQVQKDLFFQTSEFFELTRGQDSSFAIKFTNPLKYKLVKLNLQVSGILSSYLKLKESYIPTLDVNGEFNTAIEIVSPKYFNPGKYDLTFKITGFFLNDYNKEISFTEERAIKLYIHDVNKEEAEIYLGKMQEFIESLRKENFKLNNLPELFGDANALFYARDYDAAKMKFELAQEIYNSVIDAELRSRNISGLISYANSQGLATPNTNRLLVLAELAIKRGDYALALSRLKEAELTYTIETKGEINLFIFALANIDRIILIIILGVIAFYLFSLGYGMIKINRQLSDYNAENNLLLSMIAGIQKKSFVENKMSLGEYYDALGQFENRIAVVSEKIIQLTTRKNNMLTFSTPSTKLRKEKASLLDLIKQTQKQYFNMGLIETRVYQTKVESLTKRLSEVDEDIVSSDLRKTIRLNQKGVLKYFWKLYYRVFK